MKNLIGLAATTCHLAQSAHAVPSSFPAPGVDLSPIRNNTTSTVLSDTDSATQAWVLPPTAGTVTTNGLRGGSANLGFCKDLASLQDYASILIRRQAELAQEELEYRKTVLTKREEANRLVKEAEKIKTTSVDLTRYTDMLSLIETLTQKRDEQYTKLDNCNERTCSEIQKDIKSLDNQIASLRIDAAALRSSLGKEINAYNRAKALADAAKEEAETAGADYQRIKNNIVSARRELQGLYSDFAKLEGGYTTIEFNSGWDENVARLREENPGFSFSKIETQSATVNASLVAKEASQSEYLSTLPAILD